MSIKEILVLSAVILASIFVSHPTRPLQAVRDLEVKILREVGRTNNWGNPSIFASHTVRAVSAGKAPAHRQTDAAR
jgi:hypothetical protein